MSPAVDYVQLTHAASEIDGTIEEVYAARGTYGSLSAKIASKQDELTEAQLAAANSGITAAKLTADEAALAEVVDAGAKNLLNIENVGVSGSYGTSFLTNGVRFTVNTDGTITVNRESSSSSNATVGLALGASSVDVKSLCDGAHVLSGCPSGGSSSTFRLYAAKGNYVRYDTGSGVILGDTTETTVSVLITIYSGYSASNLVFKPMICTAADWAVSQKFVPYCPSMQELYQMILALQNGTRSAPALAMAEPEVEPETGEEEMR